MKNKKNNKTEDILNILEQKSFIKFVKSVMKMDPEKKDSAVESQYIEEVSIKHPSGPLSGNISKIFDQLVVLKDQFVLRPFRLVFFRELLKIYGIDGYTDKEIEYLENLCRKWKLMDTDQYSRYLLLKNKHGGAIEVLSRILQLEKMTLPEHDIPETIQLDYEKEILVTLNEFNNEYDSPEDRLANLKKISRKLQNGSEIVNKILNHFISETQIQFEANYQHKVDKAPSSIGHTFGETLDITASQYWDTDIKKLEKLENEDINLMNECSHLNDKALELSNLNLNTISSFKELKTSGQSGRVLFLVDDNPDIIVVGDIHGHYCNLKSVLSQSQSAFFSKVEKNPNSKLIFLGDYIDRGFRSSEVIRMVCLLKKNYPNNVFLIRGNHEEIYPVSDNSRYESMTYPADWITEFQKYLKKEYFNVFYRWQESLHNVVVVSTPSFGNILFTHGGIVRAGSINKIKTLSHLNDPEIARQMRWGDPVPDKESLPNVPDTRFPFGKIQFEEFLDTVGVDVMIRGHESIPEGFQEIWDQKCMTVFSAGGTENADGYPGYYYDYVKPHYLTITSEGFTAHEILYQKYSQQLKQEMIESNIL